LNPVYTNQKEEKKKKFKPPFSPNEEIKNKHGKEKSWGEGKNSACLRSSGGKEKKRRKNTPFALPVEGKQKPGLRKKEKKKKEGPSLMFERGGKEKRGKLD